jgi:hypothetical protein
VKRHPPDDLLSASLCPPDSIARPVAREIGPLRPDREYPPLSVDDAVSSATLWSAAPSLSLGDRCCLALALRLGVPAVTGDRSWLGLQEIRLIR